ncbi:MAG: GNAT family N-acetyltransferase [Ruminococcus sp.]|nr:GNAT family N-acetyltransferase [Ruminococcus sp.]
MLKKLFKQDVDFIYALLEGSFPADEYRTYEEQKGIFDDPRYTAYGFCGDDGKLLGFVSVWELKEIVFVEHLAVLSGFRGRGIGSELLSGIALQTDKQVCLEVEPPLDEESRRRIAFYEKNGFFFNDFPYVQPPMTEGKREIPLFIMTGRCAADRKMFEKIKTTLYTEIYKTEKKY